MWSAHPPHLSGSPSAGAIAGKVRDAPAGTTVITSVTGIGPLAVLKNVKAFATAAEYLKESHTLTAVPQFVDLPAGEETRTGVRMQITAVPIPGGVVSKAPPKKA